MKACFPPIETLASKIGALLSASLTVPEMDAERGVEPRLDPLDVHHERVAGLGAADGDGSGQDVRAWAGFQLLADLAVIGQHDRRVGDVGRVVRSRVDQRAVRRLLPAADQCPVWLLRALTSHRAPVLRAAGYLARSRCHEAVPALFDHLLRHMSRQRI